MVTTQGPTTIEDIDAELPEEAREYRVVGPPGCGKTTYLGRQVERAVNKGRNPFICSLTKAAAAEVSDETCRYPSTASAPSIPHCFYTLGQPKIADDKSNSETGTKDTHSTPSPSAPTTLRPSSIQTTSSRPSTAPTGTNFWPSTTCTGPAWIPTSRDASRPSPNDGQPGRTRTASRISPTL